MFIYVYVAEFMAEFPLENYFPKICSTEIMHLKNLIFLSKFAGLKWADYCQNYGGNYGGNSAGMYGGNYGGNSAGNSATSTYM